MSELTREQVNEEIRTIVGSFDIERFDEVKRCREAIMAHDAAQRAQAEQDRQRIEAAEADAAQLRDCGEVLREQYNEALQRLAAVEQERCPCCGKELQEHTHLKKIPDMFKQIESLTTALAQARGAFRSIEREMEHEDGTRCEGIYIKAADAADAIDALALAVPAAGGGEHTEDEICLGCEVGIGSHAEHVKATEPAPTPGLVWTTERPTVPGWYWWRDCETREAEVCEVYTCQLDGRTLRVNWTTDCYTNGTELAEYDLGHWAGPLSLPKEA